MIESSLRDLRRAARALARSPGYTATGVLSLALGIGANAAIFGMIDALVLRPLPGVHDVARVVEATEGGFAYPAFLDLAEAARSLDGLAAYSRRTLNLDDHGESELVATIVVSADYFRVLGVGSARGRMLGAADDTPGAPLAIVLAERLWRERYGGDPDVLGRTLSLNGQRFTVVGVAAAGFRGTKLADNPFGWISIHAWSQVKRGSYAGLDIASRGWGWLHVVGRLAPGAAIEAAEAELRASARAQVALHPRLTRPDFSVRLVPARATAAGLEGTRELARFTGLLMGAVALALLIACVNLANLQLARGMRRRHEIGLRRALGASRARIVRESLTESLLIGSGGVLAGALVGSWGMDLIARLRLPGGIDVGSFDLALTPRVLGFAAALGFITTLGFGLLPALRAAATGAQRIMNGRTPTESRRGVRLRAALVAAQVALCLPLLTATGLFVRSLQEAMRTDLGYDADRLGYVHVDMATAGLAPHRIRALMMELRSAALALPDVEAAAWIGHAPLSGEESYETFRLAGAEAPDGSQPPSAEINFAGAGVFEAAGIRLLRGRGFDENEAAPVAVVSDAFVRRFAPDQPLLGREITMAGGRFTVIGVAADAKYHGVTDLPSPYVYLHDPSAAPENAVSLLIRARSDPALVLTEVTTAARALQPGLPVLTRSVAERLRASLTPQRIAAALFAAFAALTLLLAMTGIYGVVSYIVGMRTREFGIRVALGASAAEVVRLVVRDGARPVLIGAVLGFAGVLVGGRVLRAFLYGIGPADVLTLAASAVVLLLTAGSALLLPTIRAAQVDPVQALRQE